jgi:hypothetical protein
MSMESRCTIGRDRVEKGQRVFAGQLRMLHRRDRAEVRGPVAMMTLSQSSGGSRRFRPLERDQGMGLQRRRDGGGKSVAVDRERATGRHLVGTSAACMISELSRRISACSRPTALLAALSSERNELEQTSSAKLSVLWAAVPRSGRISCSVTGTP